MGGLLPFAMCVKFFAKGSKLFVLPLGQIGKRKGIKTTRPIVYRVITYTLTASGRIRPNRMKS